MNEPGTIKALQARERCEPSEGWKSGLTLNQVTRRYYTLWWIYSFGGAFLYGVYPLFLRSRGLSQFQINSVLAVYFAITFLTDVPTGAAADAMGRRTAFIIGCALRIFAYLTYFFAHSYEWFLLAEFVDGVGTTFGNGAIDAWGVDALDAAGFEGAKDKLFMRVSQLTNFGFMLAAMIGASAASIDIAWPWLLGTAGYFLSVVAGAVLMLERHAIPPDFSWKRVGTELVARIRGGIRQGFGNRPVFLLSIAAGLEFGAWAPYWMEWPHYFTDRYQVGIWVIGWIFCLFSIGRLLGAEAVIRYRPKDDSRIGLLALVTAAGGTLLFLAGVYSANTNVVLFLLMAMNVSIGAVQPLAQSVFNEHIDACERTTLLSFQSTFSTLGASIGLLLGGIIADTAGISAAWKAAGGIFLTAAICYRGIRPQRIALQAPVESGRQ